MAEDKVTKVAVTKVGETVSNAVPFVIGLPQSSVLGPLFFLIFINELAFSTFLLTTLFADDTTF